MADTSREIRVLSPQVMHIPVSDMISSSTGKPVLNDKSGFTVTTKDITANAQGKTDPELIILFTWMGALPKHIAKYSALYNRLYPTAAIVIVRTSVTDMMFRSTAAVSARLKPAYNLIRNVVVAAHRENRPPRILAQSFSNGGTFALLSLARIFQKRSNASLPLTALVLDSGPGKGHYARSVHAIMISAGNKPVYIRIPMLLAVHTALTLMKYANRIRGIESVITRTFREMSTSTTIGTAVARLYLFSVADRLVDWQDVQAGAEEARRQGVGHVEIVKFESSEHVAHLRAYPKEYVEAIKGFWEAAMIARL